MSKPGISIGPEDPRQADVRRIIAELGAYLQALYPSESNHLVDCLDMHSSARRTKTSRVDQIAHHQEHMSLLAWRLRLQFTNSPELA